MEWKCELCGKKAEMYIFLPIKKDDGSLSTVACPKCAEQSPAYCNQHHSPHLGFEGGGTACIQCIGQMVEERRHDAPTILQSLAEGLLPAECQELQEAAEASIGLVGGTVDKTVLRFVVTKALRTGMSVDEVTDRVISEKSADFILS